MLGAGSFSVASRLPARFIPTLSGKTAELLLRTCSGRVHGQENYVFFGEERKVARDADLWGRLTCLADCRLVPLVVPWQDSMAGL